MGSSGGSLPHPGEGDSAFASRPRPERGRVIPARAVDGVRLASATLSLQGAQAPHRIHRCRGQPGRKRRARSADKRGGSGRISLAALCSDPGFLQAGHSC
jgi:hypothetical protein